MKKYILIATFIAILNLSTTPVYALVSSPSATPTPVQPGPTATSSASLQSKLRALQEEIASKAAQLKQQVTQNLQNKAYVGLFNSGSDSSFKITTLNNSTKTISVNEFTQYSSQAKVTSKSINLKSLVASDSVAALGDIDDNGILTAKRVIKLPPFQLTEKQLISGSVSDINNQTITLKDKLGRMFTIKLSANTDFKQGLDDINLNSIKVNQTVIALVDKLSESSLSARLIYSYPTVNTLKNKTASPSATTSPSAKPKKN